MMSIIQDIACVSAGQNTFCKSTHYSLNEDNEIIRDFHVNAYKSGKDSLKEQPHLKH